MVGEERCVETRLLIALCIALHVVGAYASNTFVETNAPGRHSRIKSCGDSVASQVGSGVAVQQHGNRGCGRLLVSFRDCRAFVQRGRYLCRCDTVNCVLMLSHGRNRKAGMLCRTAPSLVVSREDACENVAVELRHISGGRPTARSVDGHYASNGKASEEPARAGEGQVFRSTVVVVVCNLWQLRRRPLYVGWDLHVPRARAAGR